MTEAQVEALLANLCQYVETYPTDESMTILELADDLAMSMTPTTDLADRMRQRIEAALINEAE